MSIAQERQAFLSAITENPIDKMARLSYADWLDENSPSLFCPRCEGTS